MTINRSNLTTSGYGDDVFRVDGAKSPFTNLGRLTTTGDFASPIKATADDVTIVNKGDLATSGNGAHGIFAGDYFAQLDGVTVINYGSITTSGDFLDDGVNFAFGADGIELNGNNGTVKNYGMITTLGPDSAGIGHIGANSTLLNYGGIEAAGIGIVVDTIDGSETGNSIVNYGNIHTTGDGSHAIWVFAEGNVIKNYGSIRADGFNGFGIAMDAAGNHGENYGTILVTGEIGRGVLLLGEGNSFDNYGLVRATGEGGLGIRFSSENPAGTDGGLFTNYGKVEGVARSVSGVDSDDHVINRGSLVGAVSLGSGNDSYVAGKGGSLSGELILGAGDDLITFEKGGGKLVVADFAAGTATDDVIDLSALGIHSFAELMAHATQSGTDVLLKFGAKDQIVLEHVNVGDLSADDFGFANSLSSLSPHATHDWFIG
jgi:hypothetical protein